MHTPTAMAYTFAPASSNGRNNIAFGPRFTPKGARTLHTYKVRFTLRNADFFARYLEGRLPNHIVSQDRLIDKKGIPHETFTLATFDGQEFVVFQKAVELTEIYGVKQKLQDLERAHQQKWEPVQVECTPWDDDLPF
jgi:hypothetical protein